MNPSVWIVLAACIILIEGIVLRSVLAEAMWLKGLFCGSSGESPAESWEVVSEIPGFRGEVLDSANVVTESDLLGNDSMVFFVDAPSALAGSTDVVGGVMYALWHKTDQCLYVICRGTPDECRNLSERCRVAELYADTAKFIVDATGEITAQFGVNVFPSAISFDESGRAVKRGQIDTSARAPNVGAPLAGSAS